MSVEIVTHDALVGEGPAVGGADDVVVNVVRTAVASNQDPSLYRQVRRVDVVLLTVRLQTRQFSLSLDMETQCLSPATNALVFLNTRYGNTVSVVFNSSRTG